MGSGTSKTDTKNEPVGILSIVFDHSSSLSFVIVGGVIILGMVACYAVTKLIRSRRLQRSNARRAQDVELELFRRDRAKRGPSSRFSSFRRPRHYRRAREQPPPTPPYPTFQQPGENLILGTLSQDGLRLMTRQQNLTKQGGFDTDRFSELPPDTAEPNTAAVAAAKPTTDIAQQLLAAHSNNN